MQKIALAVALASVLIIIVRKAMAYANDSLADGAAAPIPPLMRRGNSHAQM
jgi:hypothetical protein